MRLKDWFAPWPPMVRMIVSVTKPVYRPVGANPVALTNVAISAASVPKIFIAPETASVSPQRASPNVMVCNVEPMVVEASVASVAMGSLVQQTISVNRHNAWDPTAHRTQRAAPNLTMDVVAL